MRRGLAALLVLLSSGVLAQDSGSAKGLWGDAVRLSPQGAPTLIQLDLPPRELIAVAAKAASELGFVLSETKAETAQGRLVDLSPLQLDSYCQFPFGRTPLVPLDSYEGWNQRSMAVEGPKVSGSVKLVLGIARQKDVPLLAVYVTCEVTRGEETHIAGSRGAIEEALVSKLRATPLPPRPVPKKPPATPSRPEYVENLVAKRNAPVIAKPAPLAVQSAGRLAFTVLDSRPDVLSGGRNDTFTGISRSLYGIPYPDDAKKPLAVELGVAIYQALAAGGIRPASAVTPTYAGRAKALEGLKGLGADRLVLIEVFDWWTDHMVRTDLHHDIMLTVFNSAGQELGSSRSTGHGLLERDDLDTAFNHLLARLFGDAAIRAALAEGAMPKLPAGPGTCTIDQILKMKDAGLSQAQIEAACAAKP